MKRNLLIPLIFVLVLIIQCPVFSTAASENKEPLPNLSLIVPENQEHRDYLGLQAEPGETFTFEDIKADVLLIQLFSMYCPFCQEEAPNVNELYKAMQEFSQPDFTVKIIGLGANNSAFEVDHFKNTYDVEFPLFPDPDMNMYKTLGGKGTPGFIGCKKDDKSQYSIVLRQSGGFNQVEEFLNDLLRKSGYN
ncbi:TlpA family protein disulfide reductase [Desulfosediminicola flagellatus]|uniref:TlpA family protein disulfide reductase n=1 Tax=Desulfosediminicola flagellatus TaxID=2569541 RepID=UPI0010AC177E|nr:TlpA disulfide reductase family protein [Desulfosediminicola flagellatus]